MNPHPHVVVVGAQPVGLCTALGLAQRGIRVTVVAVDSDEATCFQFVHNWSVLPGLDGLGVLADARAAGSSETTIGIYIGETDESIILDLGVLGSDVRFPFNLHLEESRLSDILLEHLLGLPEVTVVRAARITAVTQSNTGVRADMESPAGSLSIDADWLVAADGTNSTVRRLLGIGFPGFTWRERSVSMLVTTHQETSDLRPTTFVVGRERSALLQKAGSRRWTCAFTESLELSESSLQSRVSAAANDFFGPDLSSLDGWVAARMHHRSAETFRAGRVLLAGAAAHVTNRIVGHSSITGFFDAYRLVEALTAHIEGVAGDWVLDTWATSRRRIFLDDVAPLSSSRKQLLSLDVNQLSAELDFYREAAESPDALRDMLLVNRTLAGHSPLVLQP